MEQKPITSLDAIRELIQSFPGPDEEAIAATQAREPNLTKPQGSLGRLEELTVWLAGWQGKHPPKIELPRVIVFAGSHGVTAQGVSAFPAEVNHQMVANFQSGGAAINQLCKVHDAELNVMEAALEIPTRDFSKEPAMDDADCAEAVAFGMSGPDVGLDVLCVGEMGIGNTTASAAICHALYGGDAEDWVGPGTGVEGDALANKIRVVKESVILHQAVLTDGLEILRCFGGREMAAICGAIIAARLSRIPVLLDGYVTCAAAAVLHAMDEHALDHCVVAHISAEPGHRILVEKLGKVPLLDFGMRLGEGSGAALGIGLLRSAVACHNGMATFEEAAVSNKE
ncbi:MAG: nicotinate-nucleotide--dimethylbenzimidazole phosphoribosyltransferase [Rhodospirillaceae bacterium]|jgi:nicotinate-nucleotide--dimethylbenzimidazole phosphoribosyltransferase|nr:nicotinate-nucleotide--dimethylbenzimidazole phosphoribosyltransferase [Rhodospirillaceae bacterium]MBT4941071.1 nicotinate-nucleotide--dimethylbenzimidazole phosphoribosyltransferase [Rhodospirillaceae bacterium]MBT5940651.1 nicotinate-nucleotide--dimethylbenzimidazole phosphoribosyltransferase [Rhodospirillaceae bacterium]MBT7265359.1 nicotinate-nucleotide--dimethylbenzimidazole phosphoribosyltransferase [Rhodospirillaceae bacterium]